MNITNDVIEDVFFVVEDLAQSSLAPGNASSLKVGFSAERAGDFSGVLRVQNGSGRTPIFEISLSGKAIAPLDCASAGPCMRGIFDVVTGAWSLKSFKVNTTTKSPAPKEKLAETVVAWATPSNVQSHLSRVCKEYVPTKKAVFFCRYMQIVTTTTRVPKIFVAKTDVRISLKRMEAFVAKTIARRSSFVFLADANLAID
ncbi:MAG: hypothetical protein GY822_14255 [Deltaproteobacteria bacterium]|nr:hypothetical protein [Deltaproteobacteria bacterium]